MKFVGADIRIVDIPKPKVLELIREFIGSNDLRIETDKELNTTVTHVRASHPIDSYLRFWWKGTPQVIDWTIVELKAQTRIETRFGLHKRYRIWYWGVVVTLTTLFAIYYNVSVRSAVRIPKNSAEFGNIVNFSLSNAIITDFLALAFVAFTVKSIMHSYNDFIASFRKAIQKDRTISSDSVLESNCSFSYKWEILIFVLLGLTVVLGIYRKYFLTVDLRMLIPSAVALSVIFTLLGLLYLSVRNTNFSHRIGFCIVSFTVAIPLLIFYSLPYVNVHTQNLALLYERYMEGLVQLKSSSNLQMLPQNLANLRNALRNHFLITAFLDVVLICLAAGVISFAPKIVDDVRGWKKDFFSRQNWIISQRNVVDFTSFGRVFSSCVFILWIGISASLYILTYTIFSVFEFIIVGQNVLCATNIGKMFCNETRAMVAFFCRPIMTEAIADLFARLILLVYCLPLLGMLYKVVNKRVSEYLRNLRERNKFSLDDMNDAAGLRKAVGEIAQSLGVATPDIVKVPSKIPILGTKYIGFPNLRSYLVLSEGCLMNLEREELLGLLAHEIYHIKQHNFRWYALNLLSDYTLFGNGFLAVIVNSYQHELDADRYAAEWARKQGSVLDFINGLKAMDVTGRGVSGGTQGLEITGGRSQINERHDEKQHSVMKKLKRSIDTLFEIYFGKGILSYIHPPLEERIERIRITGEGFAENKE